MGQRKQVEFTPQQRETLKLMQEDCPPHAAALITEAVRGAFKDAHDLAIKDPDAEIAKETFCTTLPVFMRRRLRQIIWSKGLNASIRPALNASRTNVFLYIMLGRLKLTPTKLRSPGTQASRAVYRRLIQQRAVIELLAPPQLIRAYAEDITGLLSFGYSFEFGVPSEPSFIHLSAYDGETQKRGAYLDLIAYGQGKLARVLEEKIITPILAPAAAADDVLVKTRRRRNDPKPQETADEKEKKTS